MILKRNIKLSVLELKFKSRSGKKSGHQGFPFDSYTWKHIHTRNHKQMIVILLKRYLQMIVIHGERYK